MLYTAVKVKVSSGMLGAHSLVLHSDSTLVQVAVVRVAVSLEERGPAPRQPPTSTLQPEPANTTAGQCFPMLLSSEPDTFHPGRSDLLAVAPPSLCCAVRFSLSAAAVAIMPLTDKHAICSRWQATMLTLLKP